MIYCNHMEQILIYSQTAFYLTFSLAIIILGLLFAIVAYHLIRITQHLNKISENLDNASEEITENIKDIIERLSSLPILSFLMKRKIGKKAIRK